MVISEYSANGKVTTSILFCTLRSEKIQRNILMKRMVDFAIAIIILTHTAVRSVGVSVLKLIGYFPTKYITTCRWLHHRKINSGAFSPPYQTISERQPLFYFLHYALIQSSGLKSHLRSGHRARHFYPCCYVNHLEDWSVLKRCV